MQNINLKQRRLISRQYKELVKLSNKMFTAVYTQWPVLEATAQERKRRCWSFLSCRELGGMSLVLQWLGLYASSAGDTDSIPGMELRSHMPSSQ